MGSVFVESRPDEIDLLQIAHAGRDRLLAQLFEVGANCVVELGMPLGIFHLVAQQEIFFRAPALQQLHLQCIGLCKRRLREFCQLPVLILGGGADVVDRSERHHADDPDGADRGNLVGQTNPPMNSKQGPTPGFQSYAAGMQ